MKVVGIMEYRLYKTGAVAIVEIPEEFVSPKLANKMGDAVRKELVSGTSKLIVDLSRCSLFSTVLMGALVRMYMSFTNIGGHILYAAPQSRLQSVLQLLKLDQVFEVVESVDAALARLATRHERSTA